jgi:hypothetical protein
VKRLLTVLVAVTFALGAVGLATAQEKKTTPEKTGTSEKIKMTTKTAVGTVKSASTDSVVVAGKSKGKDTEWTFALDPKTKVRKGGKDATAADLKAGDPVSVRYTEHDGRATAQAITVTAKRAEAKPAETKK